MGIVKILTKHLESKLGILKHTPSEHEGASTGIAPEAPEISVTIYNNRKATAENTRRSIYRIETSETLVEREKERKEEEQLEKLVQILKSRFEDPENMRLRHPGMEWAKVEAKLRVNKEKLSSLNEMEINGHEPDVVDYDPQHNEYMFCTCSSEGPAKHRNLVYCRSEEDNHKKHHPKITCKGNVTNIAEKMKIYILDKNAYLKLQTKGEFDRKSLCWLRKNYSVTDPIEKRQLDCTLALLGHRTTDDNSVVYEFPNNSFYEDNDGKLDPNIEICSFRGYLWI